jgi:hypothetical protein
VITNGQGFDRLAYPQNRKYQNGCSKIAFRSSGKFETAVRPVNRSKADR